MSTPSLPSDHDSLLVPIHLDAWVVGAGNQESTQWFPADYGDLGQFEDPFFNRPGPPPGKGVHLSWALPDAVTHGHQVGPSTQIEFPLVPNRWLVLRSSPPKSGSWPCRLWVIESDYLDAGGDGGSSAFLDPSRPTQATVGKDFSLKINIATATIGKSYSIEQWEAAEIEVTSPFLQAVGPGNAAFSAYVPYHQNVFSFLDSEAAEQPALYSYMVVGWYSQPETMDPLRGVLKWMPSVWPTQEQWQGLSETTRFQDLLTALRWSTDGGPPASPPSTSLFHGSIFCVDAACATLGNAGIPSDQIQVAVGNTGADALAALVKSEASKLAAESPAADRKAWTAAGEQLAELLRAAQYDLLEDVGKPGGRQLVDQQAHQAWFGSKPGGTVWEVVAAPGATEKPTPAQQAKLDSCLAGLNSAQRDADEARRDLESMQSELYILWWKLANLLHIKKEPPFEKKPHDFNDLVAKAEKLYPQLTEKVWTQTCQVRQKESRVPQASGTTTLNQAAEQWADADPAWRFPKADGQGTLTLSELGLRLKAVKGPRFWHPNDPVVLIAGLHRARRRGEDGRENPAGDLACRLPGKVITGIEIDSTKIDASTLGGAVDLDPMIVMAGGRKPLSGFQKIPKIPLLVGELFLSDPNHAAFMASVTRLSFGEVRQHLSRLTGAALSIDNPAGEGLELLTPSGDVIQGIGPKTADVALGASEINLMASIGLEPPLPPGSTVRDGTTKTFVGKTGDVLSGENVLKIPLQISGTWLGTLPASFSMRQWEQAWAPFLLSWQAQYFPTGNYPPPGPNPGSPTPDRDFYLGDWSFDGQDYTWTGRSGYESDYSIPIGGHALLTPHIQDGFSKKLSQYLQDHPAVDSRELETLRRIVLGWDFLAQALSGFTDQLISLQSRATFPPPPDPHPQPPGCGDGRPTGSPPTLTQLVGEGYHLTPVLDPPAGSNYRGFYPIRGGFLALESLSVVDEFGQEFGGSTSKSPWLNSENGFVPLFGAGLKPDEAPAPPAHGTPGFPAGMIQLPPRIAQPSRLDFHLLGQDELDLAVSEKPNPLRGWLVPNHLDGAVSVYSRAGLLLGEISPSAPDHWRPRPGADPPVKQLGDLKAVDTVLAAVVSDLAGQSTEVFNHLLNTIDETLWTVDPLGGRKDQMMSVMLGRPLAIVQAELGLSLYGPPSACQFWQSMLAAEPDFGQVEDTAFPVQLGSVDLRHDGLIGYFLNGEQPAEPPFFAVHYPETLSGTPSWIRPIGGYTLTGDAVDRLIAVAEILLPLKNNLTVGDGSSLSSLRAAITHQIGQVYAGRYRSWIVDYAFQLGSLPLSATELEKLKAGLGPLKLLEGLKNISFATETELLDAVAKTVGEAAADFYRPMLIELAQEPNRLGLKPSGPPTRLTLLLDPRGSVHASSGILPVTRVALPTHTVEQLLGDFSVTFHAGPAIFAPDALRFPEPAEIRGTWSWIAPGGKPAPITPADDRARLPARSMELRDGWLELNRNQTPE